MKDKILPIIELYRCVQTEGSMAGRPHILLRTTGCTHRCFFGEGGYCDTWYSSIHPDKGKYTMEMIEDYFYQNSDITHLMISGGSPTMHRDLVNDIINLFHQIQIDNIQIPFVTIETEGSHYIETDISIDLVSLSPKFSNSVPQLGIKLPLGDKVVDQSFIDQHNKFRLNHEAIDQMIAYHRDYHFKPVVDRNNTNIWNEIEEFRSLHNIPKNKTWIMPAGSTRAEVIPNYEYVLQECIDRGYNFTGRAHIIAFSDQRLK